MILNPLVVEGLINQGAEGNLCVVDIGACEFAELHGLAMLLLVVRHFGAAGLDVLLKLPSSSDVLSYLERANFLHEVKDFCRTDRSVACLQSHARNPTDRLVEFQSIGDHGQFATVVRRFADKLAKRAGVTEPVVDAVYRALAETLQNISDHADPLGELNERYSVVGLQEYSWHVCLSVGDLGVGIRRSLSLASKPKFQMEKFGHADAIETALNGRSRLSTDGRGGGLSSVESAVRKVGGSMTVRSGDACVRIDGSGRHVSRLKNFPGTQISIDVPLAGHG